MLLKKSITLTILLIVGFQYTMAQRTITGRVISNENGKPLSGTTIIVKGTTIGTVTDNDGRYSININEITKTLVFSHPGLQTFEYNTSSSNVVNVVMSKKGTTNIDLKTSIYTSSGSKQSFFKYYQMEFIYSYQHSHFYSSKFNGQLESGLVKYGYGDIYTFRQSLDPIILDVSGFISRYNSPVSINDIKFKGFEIDVAIRIPYIPKYLLRPYIGIGYQYSQVDNNESYINSSQTVWKVGITPFWVKLGGKWAFYINGEYKQSMDISNPYSFNQFSVGLGIRFF